MNLTLSKFLSEIEYLPDTGVVYLGNGHGATLKELRLIEEIVQAIKPEELHKLADMIDCGHSCEHGYTEHDTNAFVCPKIDCGECYFERAETLRQAADKME